MSAPLYLLDTSILVTLLRGTELGQRIDATYGLRSAKNKPLVSIVTHGELRALAEANRFGAAKREAIRRMLDEVVTVDISDEAVVHAYTEVYSALRRHPKGSRTNVGENDMWIAACARAADAILLTLDGHFDPLHPELLQVRRVRVHP